MRTVIISGGRIERDFALSFLENETFEQFIAVDNGLRFCYDNQIKPTWIVGDFDTAAPELVDLIFQAWILAICLAIFSAISLAAVPEEAHPMDR